MGQAGIQQVFRRHGGRLAAAAALLPAAPRPWIDLSTGVNPDPYPAPSTPRLQRMRLPQPAETRALEPPAAAAFGGPADCLAAVPGSEAGLRLLPRLLGCRRAAIAGPAYGSHEDAWRRAGSETLVMPFDQLASRE